jgi:DNA polymerase III epsilon subunit-like protein
MKYVSVDIETTGLDPEKCDVLSIGAVIEDTNNPLPLDQLPSFHVAIKRENISGSMFAINMNKDLIETIVNYQTAKGDKAKQEIVENSFMRFLHEDEVAIEFYYFLYSNGLMNDKGNVETLLNGNVTNHPIYGMVPAINQRVLPSGHINVAGKNFGTFDKLFLERLPRWKQLIKMRNRILDPAILFVDWKSDDALPGLNLCKVRSNTKGEVTHNALEDAIDVVAVLRTKY